MSPPSSLERSAGPAATRLLGGLTPAGFLRRHWQKRPLLVRGAFDRLPARISAEELAGLACEPDVESRVVTGDTRTQCWELHHGPFEEAFFRNLPERDWTLLVQDTEKHLPALDRVLTPFRFIPDWRLDDLMISYAAPGGTVGPHIDRYDVFLVQAEGRRRWQIRFPPDGGEPLRDDSELRLLTDFRPSHEWLLEPGDMLYLPPGVPHYGVAEDTGMTYSVGFRAPAAWELVAAWMDERLQGIDDELRYADPDLRPPANGGEIPEEALRRLRDLVRRQLDTDDETLNRFLGRLLTEPKPRFRGLRRDRPLEQAAVAQRLADGDTLVANPAARPALVRGGDGGAFLFAAGTEYPLDERTLGLAERLTADGHLDSVALKAGSGGAAHRAALVTEWLNAGILLFKSEWD